jgi:hypothetical protein
VLNSNPSFTLFDFAAKRASQFADFDSGIRSGWMTGAGLVIRKGKKAKRVAAKKWKPKTVKKRPPTQREISVAARLDTLRLTQQAAERMQEITVEIDRAFGGGPMLKREVAGKKAAARAAFDDAILNSNSIKEWVAEARKAAGL